MPASLPIRPLGRVVSMPLIGWVPSALARRRTKGVKTPAVGSTVPALKDGLWGAWLSLDTQAPPPAPLLISKESDGVALATSGALHGVRSVVVVKVPQAWGVFRAARERAKKLTWRSSKGNWGLSLKVPFSWPVLGSASAWPGSLPSWPLGSSAAM